MSPGPSPSIPISGALPAPLVVSEPVELAAHTLSDSETSTAAAAQDTPQSETSTATAAREGSKRKAVTFPPGSTPPKQRKTDEATQGLAETDHTLAASAETETALKLAEQQQVDVIKVYKARVAEKKQQIRHLKKEVFMKDAVIQHAKNDASAKAALIEAKDDVIKLVKSIVAAKEIVIEAKDEKIALLELEISRLSAQQAVRIRNRATAGSVLANRARRAARRRRRHETAPQPEAHATT